MKRSVRISLQEALERSVRKLQEEGKVPADKTVNFALRVSATDWLGDAVAHDLEVVWDEEES